MLNFRLLVQCNLLLAITDSFSLDKLCRIPTARSDFGIFFSKYIYRLDEAPPLVHSIFGYLYRIGAAPFRECLWGPLTRNPNLRFEIALCKSRPVNEGFMINGQ